MRQRFKETFYYSTVDGKPTIDCDKYDFTMSAPDSVLNRAVIRTMIAVLEDHWDNKLFEFELQNFAEKEYLKYINNSPALVEKWATFEDFFDDLYSKYCSPSYDGIIGKEE
jgi:hypothetical protein